jgi:hypothetical protein
VEEISAVEVRIGEYLPDGRFKGREIAFDGSEVDVHDGLWTDTVDPGDVYGFVLRLYECPDGYRVHELVWHLVPGRSAVASLYPAGAERGDEAYTPEEARELWAEYFPDHFELE